jgi:uncharacterized OsmC-like protein
MVTVDYVEGSKFRIGAREHVVYCDQPLPVGENEAMGPVELFLGALGTCAAFYAKQFMAVRGLDATGLQVRVSAERAERPQPHIHRIRIAIKLPPGLPERYHEPVRRAAETCFLFRSMPRPVQMETELVKD